MVDTQFETPVQASLKRFATFIFLVVLLAGVVVLVGWVLDLEWIKRPLPELAAMNPLTALCFVASATSFLLIASDKKSFNNIGYTLTALLILTGVARLLDLAMDNSLAIDQMVFSEILAHEKGKYLLNHMAANTAVAFLLTGVVLLLIRSQRRNVILFFQFIGLLILLVALFSIMGYAYSVPEFFDTLRYLPMAPHTAICFHLIGIGVLFYSCGRGVMREITSPFFGGRASRILVPLGIIIPFLLGIIMLGVFRINSISPALTVSTLILSITIVFVLLIWLVTYSLNEKDKARNEAEKLAELSYALLQASFEAHHDILIFTINKQYQYLNFNKAFAEATFRAYGMRVQNGGSMLDSITSEEDREKAKNNCDEALSGKSISTLEVYGDLTPSYFSTRYSPVVDESGKIIGATVLSSDVTHRKMQEEEIQELNKDLEAFSYSIAHDLRAPLRLIDGFSNVLMEDFKDKIDEEGNKLLQTIVKNTRNMGMLIDGLLSFSKLGSKHVKKEHFQVSNMLQQIIEEQIAIPEKEKIEIRIGKLEDLRCDPNLMKHVFSNLISNAIKYSLKKPKVMVDIDSVREAGKVTYSIRDNGVGFDMKYADKLFGVFQRLHRETEFKGTGIGLATTHKIITKHGGKIWAESEVDKGSVFRFSLPV